MRERTQATLIILALVIVSGLVFLSQRNRFTELEQRYLSLSEKYDSQALELDRLQSTLEEAEETIEQYNNTLTSLEAAPIVKAANIIISQVGVEYFNQYFHDPSVQIANWNPNVTIVTYKYYIQVENYTIDWSVKFYFYPNLTIYYDVPIESNLQPFTVTAEEAKRLAVDGGLPDGPYELEASIQCVGPGDVYPLTGDEEKYVWRIVSWEDPPWANPRRRQSAHVDPVSGEVYAIRHGGRTVHEEHVDTPEEALPYGVEGYVRLHYSDLPRRINLTDADDITFSIQMSFISHVKDLNEVKVTIDPRYNNTYGIHGNLVERLRDYLSYEPSGDFVVRVGETLNITCTLRLTASEQELSFNRYSLHGLGIGAENILIVHDLDT
jgi:lipopolysaccharide export system protein LptC